MKMTKWILQAACVALVMSWGARHSDRVYADNQPRSSTPAQKQGSSLRDIWHEILKNQQIMAKMIADKNVLNVDKPGFKISFLASQMPDKSPQLSADQLSRLKQLVKDVQRLAGALDNAGDKGDLAGTQANASKLYGVLQSIAALYPTGSLPVPST